MSLPQLRSVNGADARRIAALCPSYRDFVDDALFHPSWGYYSTGAVRFGEGGHYDTYPIALSPYFGHMLARYAFKRWRARGEPGEFEIAEIGAGNGQLALDTVLALQQPLRRTARWQRFAAATRYRIIERSPALITRQRATLGALAKQVRWLRADLSQRAAPQLGEHGVLMANEVLDCLAHHKIVPHAGGGAGVVYVVPTLAKGGAIPRAQLADALIDPKRRARMCFEEVVLPLKNFPALHAFVARFYPELLRRRSFPPYFACMETVSLMAHTHRLYAHADALWIDYGEDRRYHLRSGETRKVFAGPPRSGASIFADPGRDDVTFMVDFSVAEAAAVSNGWKLMFYGSQRELALRSEVRFTPASRARILQQRALQWMLAVVGVGPEQAWRRTGLTWERRAGKGGRLDADIDSTVQEFLGLRPSYFKLLLLRRD